MIGNITRQLAVLALAATVTGLGQAASTDLINAIDITALKSLQVEATGGQLVAHTVVRFKNGSDQNVIMSGSNLDVVFTARGQKVDLGKASPDKLEFPKGQEVEYPIDVQVGPEDSKSYARILALTNLIGDPANMITMQLSGTLKIGGKIPEKKRQFLQAVEGEVSFQAKVQREVLME